jgi:hypothetical protein
MRWVPAGVIVALALALPAAAGEPEPDRVVPKPKRGGTFTTFVVRYESSGAGAFGGDELWVRGPRGTSCFGTVVVESVGHEAEPQRIAIGPRVDEGDSDGYEGRLFIRPQDGLDEGDPKPLRRWCRGVYRGWVACCQDANPEKHTRFRFAVR